MSSLRSVAALVTFAVLALAPRGAVAQAPAPVPPARLPNASPPPPPQRADTAQRVTLLVPPRPAPPPAPIALGSRTDLGTAPALIAAPPADATMRCKDGTFLTGPPAAERCRDRGGVAAIFPAPPSAVPSPRPVPR